MVVDIKVRAYESHGPHGEVRVDYSVDGKEYTFLVERIGDSSLYSKFDAEGVTLFQSLEKAIEGPEGVSVADGLRELILFERPAVDIETVTIDYKPVMIKRSCPKCGSMSLERSLPVPGEGSGGTPTAPRYKCSACGQECYHISDDYMAMLVKGNDSLFSEEERAQLKKDPEGFMKELKEYTSRIFAMKNIKRVI